MLVLSETNIFDLLTRKFLVVVVMAANGMLILCAGYGCKTSMAIYVKYNISDIECTQCPRKLSI